MADITWVAASAQEVSAAEAASQVAEAHSEAAAQVADFRKNGEF